MNFADRQTVMIQRRLGSKGALDLKETWMNFEDPWAWMQPYDARRFGEVILDQTEQERWCRAVLLGGLPFMWRKAEAARNLIYDRLELRTGDKVLIIGECI